MSTIVFVPNIQEMWFETLGDCVAVRERKYRLLVGLGLQVHQFVYLLIVCGIILATGSKTYTAFVPTSHVIAYVGVALTPFPIAIQIP